MESTSTKSSSFDIEIKSILLGINYDFSFKAKWITEKEIQFQISDLENLGDEKENLTISFSNSFKSITGSPLFINSIWTYPYKIVEGNLNLNIVGDAFDYIIVILLAVLVTINILTGGSSPLLWGFINTLQLIYFFPLLNLNFPSHFVSFIRTMRSSKVQINLPYGTQYTSRIQEYTFKPEDF